MQNVVHMGWGTRTRSPGQRDLGAGQENRETGAGEPGRGDLGARAAERYVLARERRDEPTLATFAGEKAAFGLLLAFAEM